MTAPARTPDGRTIGASGRIPPSPGRAPVSNPECFEIVFRHKTVATHPDEEACAQHKNVLKLPHAGAASLCVRVDGTPVRHQLLANGEVLVGPVAGPKATITASYCLGRQRCSRDCAIPRDEFLDAIGASTRAAPADAGRWDPEDPADAETAALAKKIETELPDEIGSDGLYLFRDWESRLTQGCGARRT